MALRVVRLGVVGALAISLLICVGLCRAVASESLPTYIIPWRLNVTNQQLLEDFAAGHDEQRTRDELGLRLQPTDPRRAEIRAGLLRLLAERQDKEFLLRAMPVVVVRLRGDPEAAKAVLSLYGRLERGPLRMVVISELGYMRAVEAIPMLEAIVRTPPRPASFNTMSVRLPSMP